MRPPLKDPNRDNIKEKAMSARNRFCKLVDYPGINLVTLECNHFDKYGRLLVTVFADGGSISVNETMIQEDHGYKYEGGTKLYK